MPEGPAPVDWQGAALVCAPCAYRPRRDHGQCGPGWSCLHDRYAPRIARFFLINPELADENLSHPYFETRALAARHASVFRLTRCLADVDPAVRSVAVLRLPPAHAERRRDDPDRGVRIAVAYRLPPERLLAMAHDRDGAVRLVVARRAEPGMLPALLADPDPEVRALVAARIALRWLDRLRCDPEPLVRRAAALRRPALFQADPDLRVRHAVAETAGPDTLRALLDDPEPIIRETAALRLSQPSKEPPMSPPSHEVPHVDG